MTMAENLFTPDILSEKPFMETHGAPVDCAVSIITDRADEAAVKKGDAFACEITERCVGDFDKDAAAVAAGIAESEDLMVHVSTFLVVGKEVFVTYYANNANLNEDPNNLKARLVWAPLDAPQDRHYIDIQSSGAMLDGRKVEQIYDTVLMQKDADTLYVMWAAKIEGNYYRLYCPLGISDKTVGEIGVNRFRVGDVVNHLSVTGIKHALAANGIPFKPLFVDTGMMQKVTSRVENGVTWYYTGMYNGNFNCIIKSTDFITWEYVSSPDFVNDSEYENSVYVLGDKCYYCVRQLCRRGDFPGSKYAYLTAYDLTTGKWEKPVLVEDSQSRSDFICYRGELYLFHAPIDREHIGILHVNTEDLSKTEILLQAKMHTGTAYPFVQYFRENELAMAYTLQHGTVRKHIRLAEFTLSMYTGDSNNM